MSRSKSVRPRRPRSGLGARRTLTAEQRADIRARIAQRSRSRRACWSWTTASTWIEAAAELTAFLISAAPDLRVLTTSRAPLAIAAERVYLLGELQTGDAAQLFGERAVAARPSVRLTEETVVSIVTAFDGLLLAIEPAAACVRHAMSVEEIDCRLEDRFALLAVATAVLRTGTRPCSRSSSGPEPASRRRAARCATGAVP